MSSLRRTKKVKCCEFVQRSCVYFYYVSTRKEVATKPGLMRGVVLGGYLNRTRDYACFKALEILFIWPPEVLGVVKGSVLGFRPGTGFRFGGCGARQSFLAGTGLLRGDCQGPGFWGPLGDLDRWPLGPFKREGPSEVFGGPQGLALPRVRITLLCGITQGNFCE